MTIQFECKSGACFKSEHMWDYAMFDGCFGSTNIRPMDVDGLIERNGYGLFIETKGVDVSFIPTGQMRTLEWMAVGLNQTVLVMYGKPNKPERTFALYPGGRKIDFGETTVDDMRRFVSNWYAWADRGGK